MSVPNYFSDVLAAKNNYADAWLHAHVSGDPRKGEWIMLLARDLRAKDNNVGANGKRGNPNDPSMDAINILCDSEDSNGRTPDGRPCVVVDVIGSAGARPPYSSSNREPFPTWQVHSTLIEGSGANVDPNGVTTPQPTPTPAPAPKFPSYEELGGDEGAKKITRVLEADYKRANRPGLDGDCGGWLRRTDYDVITGKIKTVEESIAKHRKEWCDALGIPVAG